MTFSKLAIVALFGTALLAGPALADPAETVQATSPEASWLFVQTASEAQFDGKTLTLTNINPSTVMLADRPARIAEALPTATFVAAWGEGGEKSFAADPPNAGLTSLVDGTLQSATVELSEPQLDGTTLTFKVAVIEGTVPPTAETVSLFIDGGCNPWDPRC